MKTESKIQQECYMWFHNKYCLKHHNPKRVIFSVPNESKSAAEQMYKKSLGLRAGVSDMIVLLEGGKTMFIEFKTPTGRQNDKQKEFEKTVETLGFEYYVVRSIEEFKKLFASN